MNKKGRVEKQTENDRGQNERKSKRMTRAGRNYPFLLFRLFFFICITVLNVVDKETFTVKMVLAAYNYSARQNKSQRKLLVLQWYTVNSLGII